MIESNVNQPKTEKKPNPLFITAAAILGNFALATLFANATLRECEVAAQQLTASNPDISHYPQTLETDLDTGVATFMFPALKNANAGVQVKVGGYDEKSWKVEGGAHPAPSSQAARKNGGVWDDTNLSL